MSEKLSYAIVDMDDLSNEKQHEVVEWVADYLKTVGHEQYKMLIQTKEQLLGKMGKVAFTLTHLQELGERAGYISADMPTTGAHGDMSEVGSLFVLDSYQGQGIAKDLMRTITGQLWDEGVVPYIFCNENSQPVAEAVGFTIADISDVPACAAEACEGCSLMQTGLVVPGQCCDTIMLYGGGQ